MVYYLSKVSEECRKQPLQIADKMDKFSLEFVYNEVKNKP